MAYIMLLFTPYIYLIVKSAEIYFFILWITSLEQGDHVNGYLAHVILHWIIHILELFFSL